MYTIFWDNKNTKIYTIIWDRGSILFQIQKILFHLPPSVKISAGAHVLEHTDILLSL